MSTLYLSAARWSYISLYVIEVRSIIKYNCFSHSNFAYFPRFYKFKAATPTVAYSDVNPYICVGKRLGRVFHKVFFGFRES